MEVGRGYYIKSRNVGTHRRTRARKRPKTAHFTCISMDESSDIYGNATVRWVCMLVKVNRVYAGGGEMLRWCNKGLWKELKAEYMA